MLKNKFLSASCVRITNFVLNTILLNFVSRSTIHESIKGFNLINVGYAYRLVEALEVLRGTHLVLDKVIFD